MENIHAEQATKLEAKKQAQEKAREKLVKLRKREALDKLFTAGFSALGGLSGLIAATAGGPAAIAIAAICGLGAAIYGTRLYMDQQQKASNNLLYHEAREDFRSMKSAQMEAHILAAELKPVFEKIPPTRSDGKSWAETSKASQAPEISLH